ncbi:hypothetical protein AAFC00_000302 [Neodothiora populina]|uniref:Helix-turn-helix domain-containing protein n=1 Tax=Neodothiora populina TaxID=2781224 RepID=A0ABR3PCM7_9PEZI
MGASGSKTAKAAGSAARKYPSRPAGAAFPAQTTTNAPPRQPPPAQGRQPGPTVRPQARASGERDQAINLDASDPDFARSLRSLGPVQPNPILSNSSAFPQRSNMSGNPWPVGPDPKKNPALMVLESRNRIQEDADREFLEAGRTGFEGRKFLDVGALRQILMMKERGMSGEKIEKTLELRPGLVARLGPAGLVGTTTMGVDDVRQGAIEMT